MCQQDNFVNLCDLIKVIFGICLWSVWHKFSKYIFVGANNSNLLVTCKFSISYTEPFRLIDVK